MKSLPIGIQTFRDIRDGKYVYIDKTKLIYELVKDHKGVYFLSRPRRFGKSLTLSTLKEIFEGNKELFQGLWIYGAEYDWKKYPIIRLDFSKQKAENKAELKKFIVDQLDYIAKENKITLVKEDYFARFEELIKILSERGKIVILIDEYDKPIIDHIENPELAKEMREILKGFYRIIKSSDEYLRFVFLTGVSKFSKAGVFSGLNNLNDISMTSQFSAMLGITQEEMKENFKEYILEFANKQKLTEEELLAKIKHWYNGYCFSGDCEKVYNPFSTLLLFQNKEFKNYWFETGTPSFLIELAKQKDFAISEMPVRAEEISFSTYEVDRLDIIPLLFQTGYLTLTGYNPERLLYTLDYPNFEVKNSFLQYFIRGYTNRAFQESKLYDLIDSLREKDFDSFFTILRSIFANIDYDLHIPQEKYYQTVFYLVFTLIGLRVSAEVKTNIGRIDAVIEDKDIYLFEFKFNDTAKSALAQIHKNKYFEKYLSRDTTQQNSGLYLFGVEFKDKTVGEWIVEER
ncbi:MAG TPA: AAA family ATPase [Leptospiraceae bacterium]|nr:AAA family ATPase [Leptospiraceae bacterium]